MKKSIVLVMILILSLGIIGCSTDKKQVLKEETLVKNKDTEQDKDVISPNEHSEEVEATDIPEPTKEYNILSVEGKTLETRINPPENFKRVKAKQSSFLSFIRSYALKEAGSPVLLYNGQEKGNQSAHIAVLDLSVGDKDLQQCADSIMRVYAEYYWSIGAYDKISFHLTNGFLMEYSKWREGYRLSVSGNTTKWVKSASYDDSYETLLSYLETVFMYAGTLSLALEGSDIEVNKIAPGDMFIKGGSPGHCVLVVDIVENSQGEQAFLLAQGYMPAQEFHILKNPLHEEDPWYYVSEIEDSLFTPQWTFENGSLKRWLVEE